MRPSWAAGRLLLWASAGMLAQLQTTLPGAQTFRAAADAVTVDVSVRHGDDRLAGLKASDFVLTDNGVPQQIDIVEASTIPLEVTILVDTDREVEDETQKILSQATRIASLLQPPARLRVWDISTSVSEIVPLQPAVPPAVIPALPGGGLAAVYDALAASLMEPVDPDARHLIIAITNGVDTDSVLNLGTVHDLALRSNATLHVSQIDVTEQPPPSGPPTAGPAPVGTPTGLWLTAREALVARCRGTPCGRIAQFWQPHDLPPVGVGRFDPLAAVAASTGGKLHPLGFGEHSAADVFANAFKDFQENYVLRYRPQGVPSPGWHTISITLPSYPDYAVHARRGYAIEELRTSNPATTQAPAASAPPTLVGTLLKAYEQGDYDVARATAVNFNAPTVVTDLRAEGNLWPTMPHREAVMALDVAQVLLNAGHESARKPVFEWLAAEERLIRDPIGPDSFEREWLMAELDLFEVPFWPADAERIAELALQRFPGDPRFLLDRAIVGEQQWAKASTGGPVSGQHSKQIDDVLAKYDAVIAHPEAREAFAESCVRSAWVLHLAMRDTEAMARLAAVNDADADVQVRYLHHLFKGHVLTALGRPTDAVGEYRAAVGVLPGAEAGEVALMDGLVAAGDQSAALALSEQIQTTPQTRADPWNLYRVGNYRQFPAAMGQLRTLVR